MKRKICIVAVSVIAMLAMAMPGHAFTTIAKCSGSSSINGCTTTFVATLNLDTTHVRVIPSFFYVGSAVIQVFEVGSILHQVNYESTWATGRVELEGPIYSGPYQLLAGHTYTLVVSTNNADTFIPGNGSISGVLEV